MKEKTFILIKPNGMPHWQDILNTIGREAPSLREIVRRPVTMTREQVVALYGHVQEKMGPQWEEMATWLMSRPLMAVVLEGEESIKLMRAVIGPTDSHKAARGTVRALFGNCSPGAPIYQNAIHGSASAAEAVQEMALFGF